MELKEQINKGLEENADNLKIRISFQLESLLRQIMNDKAIEPIAMEPVNSWQISKFYVKFVW